MSVAFGLLLLAGCANTHTTVESEKDYSYTQFIDHLYVVTQFADDLAPMGTAAAARVSSKLAEIDRTVDAQSFSASQAPVIQDGALRASIVENAQSSGATQVLVLGDQDRGNVITSGSAGFNSFDSFVFLAAVYDVETGKRVWTAQVETMSHTDTSNEATGREMAERVVRQLAQDSLLPSTIL